MYTQSSMVPTRGDSVTGASKCSPFKFKCQPGLPASISLSAIYRVAVGEPRLAARPGRPVGAAVGPRWLTVFATLICITAESGGTGFDTGASGLLLLTCVVRPGMS